MKQRLKVWLYAARPFSLTAAVVPVAVGTLLAARHAFHPLLFLGAFFGSVIIQVGTNLVNDYYDYVKGVDSPEALGPSGVLKRGLLTPRSVKWAGIGCFAAGSVIGIALVFAVGLPLLWLGLASVLAGFFYTAGPVSLAYFGLGEVTVFIFMGPVIVLGAYYVQVAHWAWNPVIVSLPIAFLVTAILHANNLRDIELDRAHGKRTVATFIGRRYARWEYYALVGAGYLALLVGVIVGAAPWTALVALLTLPVAWTALRLVATTTEPRRLNLVLFHTAQLHMRFGALLAVGLALRLLWR